MQRDIVAIGAACLMAVSTVGPAGAANARPATNPPPPQGAADAAYEDWADTYLTPGRFVLSGFEDDRAVLFDPASVALEGERLRVTVRGELFRQSRDHGVPERSFRDSWLLDCAGRRVKVESSEAFAQSNLQGRSAALDLSKDDWAPVEETGGGEAQLFAQACSLGSLLDAKVDRAKAMPPTLTDISADGTAAWMKRYVTADTETLAWTGSGIGVFYDAAQVSRTKSGRPRLWLHSELGVLLPAQNTMWRSMREEMEIDCSRQRYLNTAREIYPGANLTGAVRKSSDTEEGWVDVTAGSTSAKWLGAVCRQLDGKAPAVEPAPPPADKQDDAAIAAWVDAYINTNNYVDVAAAEIGVMFYGTENMVLQTDGHLLTDLRMEGFTPFSDGARSSIQRVEVDCKTGRRRILGSMSYPLNNLEGPGQEGGSSGWERPGDGTNGEGLVRQLCSQRSLTGAIAPVAMPTPLRGAGDEAAEAWIADHIVPDDYVVSGYSAEAASLYSIREIERTRQDHVRVWTRLELFKPRVVDDRVIRSMRMLVEFDCEEQRSRTLASESFPGSNLIGEKAEATRATAEWSYNSPGALMSGVANGVCALKDEADEEAEDPASALPASSGRQAL